MVDVASEAEASDQPAEEAVARARDVADLVLLVLCPERGHPAQVGRRRGRADDGAERAAADDDRRRCGQEGRGEDERREALVLGRRLGHGEREEGCIGRGARVSEPVKG